jgi:plastocyanin
MRTLPILAAAVICLSAMTANAAADNPTLVADVGANDSFEISLVDAAGVKVQHLDAGTYTLLVHDHSIHHDFHLTGPGVDVTTTDPLVGDQTFTITLADGVYTYVCDPHAVTMRGVFTVGSVTAQPPVKLAASLSAKSKGALGPLSSAPPAGPYEITVNDRSAKDGFRLTGPGVKRTTGTRFTGKVTWTVTLRRGVYEYGSVRFPKLRQVFTIYG